MISEATISNHNGDWVVKSPVTVARTSFLSLSAFFLFGISYLVIHSLLFAGRLMSTGNIAERILAWIGVGIAATVGLLSIVVLVFGLKDLLVRRSFKICVKDAVLVSFLYIAGVPVSTRRYPFSAFNRVAIRIDVYGIFTRHTRFVVACEGTQRVDLSVFEIHPRQYFFADCVAAHMGLQVTHPLERRVALGKIPGSLRPNGEIGPGDCLPLGELEAVRAAIRSAFPSAKWFSSTGAAYYGSAFWILIHIDDFYSNEPLRWVFLEIHYNEGDSEATRLLVGLTEATGWSELDTSKWVDPPRGQRDQLSTGQR